MNKDDYLCTISDEVTMDPPYFLGIMRRFKHHRNVSYGFSKKHTKDIMEYRKKCGLASNDSTIPSNLYNLPVIWNSEVTFVR